MKFPILGQNTEIDRCWQSKGVWGSRTCTELTAHNHCKNCPVYLDVGQQILNRERTDNAPSSPTSTVTPEINADTQLNSLSYLLIPLHDEVLAIPLAAVRYVVPQEKLHSIPHRRRGNLLGITHIHGQILPVLSLDQLIFGTVPQQEALSPRKSRYVVMHIQGRDVAFPVYGEISTATIPETRNHATSQSRFVSCTVRLGERLVGVLNMDRLSRAVVSEIFGEGVSL